VPVAKVLTELQDRRRFYCRGPRRKQIQVDHFIPWARYPNNGLENLLVTDSACNSDKRDHLASVEHVEGWLDWMTQREDDLDDIAQRLLWDRHPAWSVGVARSIYLRLPSGARLWRGRRDFAEVERGRLKRVLARSPSTAFRHGS